MEEALQKNKTRKKVDRIFFMVLFVLGLFLAYNMNVKNGKVPTPGVFYVDKAAYYVYLPYTFIYGFDVHKFPKGIDVKTNGFWLDMQNNRVVTKTTCGIAILWTPFFLLTHAVATVFNLEPDGFSDFYAKMTILPAVFYLVLGLFFLKRFLEKYQTTFISYVTILMIFLGTNLYFYSLKDGLMAHDTTFCLIALLLLLLKNFFEKEMKSFRLFLGIAFIVSMLILIRPTNIIVLLFFLFLDVSSFREAWNRLLFFLRPRYSLPFILVFILVYSPQFFFWHHMTGKFLYYSYPGEGFYNWKFPMMIPIWFSPLNGLFLYSPVLLFCIAGCVLMIVKKIPNGIFITCFFFLISYLFSSWYSWYYGGGFGSRPFIDFLPLIALPLAAFLGFIRKQKNMFIRSGISYLVLVTIYYSIRMTYHGSYTFDGSTWSWDDYLPKLNSAQLYRYQKTSYTYIQDFENHIYYTPETCTRDCVHSHSLAAIVDSSTGIIGKHSWRLQDILNIPVRQAEVSLWINPVSHDNTGATLEYSIEDEVHASHFSGTINFDDFRTKTGQWNRIGKVITIPDSIDQYCTINFFIRNWKQSKFYLDDLKINFD
jgi:hypothetical protein